ncbi:hypothetical protein ACA910_021510 [Epithemia clementina (nom. ined.)]
MHESEFPADFFIDKLPATPQRPTNSGPSMEPPLAVQYTPTPSLAPVLEQTPLFQSADATVSVPLTSQSETPADLSSPINPPPSNTYISSMSPTPGPHTATMGVHHMGSGPPTTQPQITLPQTLMRDAPTHSPTTDRQQLHPRHPSPSATGASVGPNPYAPARRSQSDCPTHRATSGLQQPQPWPNRPPEAPKQD